MRKSGMLFLILFTGGSILAQETPQVDSLKLWKIEGSGTITISQTSFSKNWSAGGLNSLSGLGVANFSAKYNKENSSWENTLDLNLGYAKQGKEDLRKTDDKIDFASKYGYKASKNWFYSVLFGFKTQFTDGNDPGNPDSLISTFMAPAYINLALGMDYKPSEVFSVFISPLNGKITIVNNTQLSDRGAFGVDPGSTLLFQFGGLVKATFTKEIIKNVVFESKMELFINYLDNPEIPKEIDVNWENKMNMKINDYLSTNILIHIIYDYDISNEIQLKEIFGVGLTYKF
ncbi:MAG: DUF3078 domain-containing protein [Bacteroidales bacterium]|nr:DUF3078 domain-containing protein [Bacteroidales bacterium]